MVTNYNVFIAGDVTSVHDTVNYVAVTTACCSPGGEADPRCLPIRVPDDDVHLRRSNVRCLNLTRAITYQRLGCVSNNVPGERVSFVLSHNQGIGSQTFSQRAPLMM
uniref:Uncharacterized protein n=1 Tax=Bombyx mori TaxID=7091 RepID=A0A8R2QZR1_BOMMO|nr:uncharacterized protein LOC119629149 [Bombyx mori]